MAVIRNEDRTGKRYKINRKRMAICLMMILAISIVASFLIIKTVFFKAEDQNSIGNLPIKQQVLENDSFEGIYYYEEDRAKRYAEYARRNKELSADEVVWRVNVDLDKEFYQDIKEVEDVSALPLLVNKHLKLPDSYIPENLVSTSSGHQMTEETKVAYELMRDDAGVEGYKINVGSGYRSIEYQKGLYNRYLMSDDKKTVDRFSSRAGHSEHHTGRTIDLIGTTGTLRDFVGTPEAYWVAENAWKYGFIVRYTEENQDITGYESEPWHITYIGAEAAGIMHKESLVALEEYMVKYVYHKPI